jgi:hypothetical protein
MSLAVYQDIFCRMVASLGFRERVLERPGEVLNGLDLTERERRRLLTLAAEPGMREYRYSPRESAGASRSDTAVYLFPAWRATEGSGGTLLDGEPERESAESG